MAAATAKNLEHVRTEIARACRDANRDPADATLVAVSKTFAADDIEPAIGAGQRVFGENRVQEAKAKWPALLAKHPGTQLHLIGPLQSNKAKEAIALFDAIHSVDRASLCEALAKEMVNSNGDRHCLPKSTPAPSRKRRVSCRRMRTHSWQRVAINTG